MLKTIIKNQDGLIIMTLLEAVAKPKGLAIILHGLGGFKEEPHIKIYADVFKKAGYNVLRYDATHSFGESEGNYEDATTTNYLHDLEDVIKWASKQKWYSEPFVLVGHSLGSFCCLLYAEKNIKKVKAIVPTSTVISGKLSMEAHGENDIKIWRQKGFKEQVSHTMPGVIRRIKYTEFKDRLKYDVLPKAVKLTMPILLIVGDKDLSTPIKHQKILFEKLAGPKELHIIKGANHFFRHKKHLAQIKNILSQWLKKYEKL